MENKIAVSVVMGVHNPEQEAFLAAVISICRQTFRDWEMLLCDDGSSERYGALFRQAAALDPRILVLHERAHCGLAHALNHGIFRSRGRYIARMDADDIAEPQRLARQVRFLETHPAFSWVGSSAFLFDSNGAWGLQTVPQKPHARDFLPHSPYIHPSVVFRRSVLLQNDGYNTARQFLQCEDYELFMRLHSLGYRGYNLSTPLLWYREDRDAYRRRTYARRVREMQLRRSGFRKLDLSSAVALPYIYKPLLVGLVRGSVQHWIRRKLNRQTHKEPIWKTDTRDAPEKPNLTRPR